MPRPPKLTDVQKRRLSVLEPKLRHCARIGDLKLAKNICGDLQGILRPTGHLARLYQNKNYMFEAAMEAGELSFAKAGFSGIRKSANEGTRVYLEASALLAVCYLRESNFESAKPLITEVLSDETSITSVQGRRDFRRRVIERFNEEGALATLKMVGTDKLDGNKLEEDAGRFVATQNEDEIFENFGDSVPQRTIQFLYEIDSFSQKQLPGSEQKLLPSPEEKTQKKEVGRTLFSAVRRVLWKSLCDKESDIYKAWFNEGMGAVLNKKYIGGAVAAALAGMGIGIHALGVAATALIIKLGIEVYCESFTLENIMSSRGVRKNSKRS